MLLRCVDLAVQWEPVVDVHAELVFWLCDSVSMVPQIVCPTLTAHSAFREPHDVVPVALYGPYAVMIPTH